jgi:hypothetical protein
MPFATYQLAADVTSSSFWRASVSADSVAITLAPLRETALHPSAIHSPFRTVATRHQL